MFSTTKKDKLTVTCPRTAEKVIVIQGVRLLELAAGCSGRSDTIRLLTSREVTTKFETVSYGGDILNITNIISNVSADGGSMMQHIMRESDSLPQRKLAQPASLELGNELRNIINRARELKQRDTMDGEFLVLKQAAFYSGGSIVAIWKFWPRGRGRPQLINKEFFPGTTSQALLPSTAHYSTTTGRVIILPHHQNKARVEKENGAASLI